MTLKFAIGLELLPHHLAELRGSGLSDETINAAGIYSVTSKSVITQLGYGHLSNNLPALAFPLLTADREKSPNLNQVRIKPDRPRIDNDGKLIKYEAKRGAQNRLYVPDLALQAIDDPHVPLYITEGEKKALKGCQEWLLTIALAGVWCWLSKDKIGNSHPLKDLDTIAFKDRQVFIVFDSDIVEKEGVRRAEYRLARELQKRGATVKAIRLPGLIRN